MSRASSERSWSEGIRRRRSPTESTTVAAMVDERSTWISDWMGSTKMSIPDTRDDPTRPRCRSRGSFTWSVIDPW